MNKMPLKVKGESTGSVYTKTQDGVSEEAAWYSDGTKEVIFVYDDLLGRKPVISEIKE